MVKPMTASETANIETVRKLYDEVLNQNKQELLPALLNEDIVFHTTTEERGIAAYRALTDRLRAGFAEMHFAIHDLIASGDRVVVRWSMVRHTMAHSRVFLRPANMWSNGRM